ncbi:MAG: GIY-YIG nuclease family protein [Lutibacter sp.]
MKKHNQGNVQSTKFGIHWKLVLKIEAANRSEALILEKKVKKRGAKRYIDNQFGV